MKKFFLLIVFIPLLLHADPVEHENILKIKYGGVWQWDSYLSPLRYDGQEVGIGNEWWQPFSKYEHWSHVGALDITGCWYLNPAKSNRLYGAAIQAGWGAYHHWDWTNQGVQVLIGPYLEAEWAGRYMVTNINKPYSMDAGVHIFAMSGVRWSFSGKKTSYRLGYTVRFNMIGVDYLPDYFQSYEMPCGWTVRFSTVKMYDVNKQSIEQGIAPHLRIDNTNPNQDNMIEKVISLTHK